MEVSEYLKRAHAMIADEGTWTQGADARNAGGSFVFANDASAVCWCSDGALALVKYQSDDIAWQEYNAACSFLVSAIFDMEGTRYGSDPTDVIIGFNDDNEHAYVMAAWEKAIEDAEKGD